jgi:hypothetical protein
VKKGQRGKKRGARRDFIPPKGFGKKNRGRIPKTPKSPKWLNGFSLIGIPA